MSSSLGGSGILKFARAIAVVLVAVTAVPAFAQLAGGPTRPQVVLPDGPLRNIILKNCVACHGIDDYAFHALSRERWDELLKERHAGMPVNELSSADSKLLLDYLAETFGTEATPFPRKYIPPVIDTYYGDTEGLAALETVCTECHELDRVYETRGTLARWRVLLLEMRGRGAQLPDDHDMERLAEGLSRVQSANLFE
jgi:mono/diheme cytochrome c family protein